MNSAVLVFPGSNCDRDLATALALVTGRAPTMVWHRETELDPAIDLIAIPGGFSYGDYLRAGAIARFAPVMTSIVEQAGRGLPVLGICNGFQVLCESGLLPGALTRNANLHFLNRDQGLRIESTATSWTSDFASGQEIVIPVKNGEGRYVASEQVLDELERSGRVVARYTGSNPNGSSRDIAGIANAAGNVVGIMPHPEHAVEALTGPGTDGLGFFASVLRALVTV